MDIWKKYKSPLGYYGFELDMEMVCLANGQIYDPIQKKC